MPKLLVFAPCEKVIISRDENTPTLIALLNEIRGEYALADENAPAAIPYRWSIFALWAREPSDEGRTFETEIRLVSPSGKERMRAPSTFTLTGPAHRDTGAMTVLPVNERGMWLIEIYLRVKGTAEWPNKPEATYPLLIDFVRKTITNPTTV